MERVARGKYTLIETSVKPEGIESEKYETTRKPHIKISELDFLINGPCEDNMIEVYSSKRLSFEPKGELLEMRDELRNRLKLLSGENRNLHAIYKSLDNGFFDVENVLFYNVGLSAFSHLDIKTLLFERVFLPPPQCNEERFEHYQSYALTYQNGCESSHWQRHSILAKWEGVPIPILKSDIKPHSIWFSLKNGKRVIFQSEKTSSYGLKLTINEPKDSRIKVVTILKPLLDGIVSAFHHHDKTDLNEVIFRLKKLISIPEEEITQALLDVRTSILGVRNFVQLYRDNIKWNPEDDAFHYVKIKIKSSKLDEYSIDGEIFSLEKNTAKISNIGRNYETK